MHMKRETYTAISDNKTFGKIIKHARRAIPIITSQNTGYFPNVGNEKIIDRPIYQHHKS